jgi:hypothetical protein
MVLSALKAGDNAKIGGIQNEISNRRPDHKLPIFHLGSPAESGQSSTLDRLSPGLDLSAYA